MPVLLAVLPHPDDESYAMGGTLARCVDAGVDVHLLCLTRGEKGLDLVAGRAGDALKAARVEELHASCAALGLAAPTVLDYADGRLERVHAREGVAAIAEVVARVGADAVVTLGPDAVYGHKDHHIATRWVSHLEVGRVLHAVFPAGMFEPMYRWLWGRRFPYVAPGMRKEHFGTTRDAVDLVVDVRSVEARKRASMAAHATQCGGDADALLPVDTTPLMSEEWFVVARGAALPDGAVLPTDGL